MCGGRIHLFDALVKMLYVIELTRLKASRMMDNKHIYLHAWHSIPSINPKKLEKVALFFSHNFERAWCASKSNLEDAGLEADIIEDVLRHKKTFHPEKELGYLQKQNISLVSKDDADYPLLLKEIPLAPFLLYVRGNLFSDELSVAIVGTRKPTPYGKEVAETISREIAENNISIVSGLAFGIDGIAHKTAVKVKKRTIGVLGSGIDDASIYPQDHARLAHDILESNGALISEFPPGTPPFKHHFPQRNRIIAGMTKGTVVVEAREKSGSLITAHLAVEYGREVFAVPGSLFSSASRGTHALIKEGAMPLQSADDVFRALNITAHEKNIQSPENENDLEMKIMNLLETPTSFEIIREKTSLETPILNASLSMLELKNRIKNIGNRTYIRIK